MNNCIILIHNNKKMKSQPYQDPCHTRIPESHVLLFGVYLSNLCTAMSNEIKHGQTCSCCKNPNVPGTTGPTSKQITAEWWSRPVGWNIHWKLKMWITNKWLGRNINWQRKIWQKTRNAFKNRKKKSSVPALHRVSKRDDHVAKQKLKIKISKLRALTFSLTTSEKLSGFRDLFVSALGPPGKIRKFIRTIRQEIKTWSRAFPIVPIMKFEKSYFLLWHPHVQQTSQQTIHNKSIQHSLRLCLPINGLVARSHGHFRPEWQYKQGGRLWQIWLCCLLPYLSLDAIPTCKSAVLHCKK